MSAYRQNKRMMILALWVGIFLFGIKISAYLLTQSNAIFTDALESIVNILAGAIGLYSLIYGNKPKDEDHPYGHGKVEYLSAGLEGSMILLAGIGMIGKASYHFFFPQTVSHLDLGIWLILATGLINFILGHSLERKGRRSGSLILLGGGQHLKSDAYSSAGLGLGLLLVLISGKTWIDNTVALCFGCFIAFTGYRLVRDSVSGIMDKSDLRLISNLVDYLQQKRQPDWIDIHNLRVIRYGQTLHIDCHMTLPWYYDIEKAHGVVSTVDQLVNEQFGAPVEFFIHIDPCIPSSCQLCALASCAVRQAAFQGQWTWTVSNVQVNRKHGLP